jgi:hypothetical protein
VIRHAHKGEINGGSPREKVEVLDVALVTQRKSKASRNKGKCAYEGEKLTGESRKRSAVSVTSVCRCLGQGWSGWDDLATRRV